MADDRYHRPYTIYLCRYDLATEDFVLVTILAKGNTIKYVVQCLLLI